MGNVFYEMDAQTHITRFCATSTTRLRNRLAAEKTGSGEHDFIFSFANSFQKYPTSQSIQIANFMKNLFPPPDDLDLSAFISVYQRFPHSAHFISESTIKPLWIANNVSCVFFLNTCQRGRHRWTVTLQSCDSSWLALMRGAFLTSLQAIGSGVRTRTE